MIGGFRKSASRVAITAAAGMFMGGVALAPAQAADLGGDCCADLEERVAELEATTVRKGNRKVSVKLSGQVNTGVMWWDDGVESGTYVVDNTSSSSRFRFTGSAKISAGWSAGFTFEMQVAGGGRSIDNQLDDDPVNGDSPINVREANWWIKSATLGKITVGQLQPATDNITLIELGGTGVISQDSQLWGRMLITAGNVNAVAGDTGANTLIQAIDTTPRSNAVRYDTPTFAGFTLSAAWGEDDIWDVALRYAGEFNGLRIAAGIGYFDSTDDSSGAVNGIAANENDSRVLGSASVWHVPTGIFASVYYNTGNDGSVNDSDTSAIGGRAGWRGKLTPLGHTSIYGGYAQYENDNVILTISGAALARANQEATMWEVGVVQRIDAAAMELFLGYKQYQFDIVGIANENDQSYVFGGGRIKF